MNKMTDFKMDTWLDVKGEPLKEPPCVRHEGDFDERGNLLKGKIPMMMVYLEPMSNFINEGQMVMYDIFGIMRNKILRNALGYKKTAVEKGYTNTQVEPEGFKMMNYGNEFKLIGLFSVVTDQEQFFYFVGDVRKLPRIYDDRI